MKTLIIGASHYPFRFSYKAAHMLSDYDIEFIMIGKREGSLLNKEILSIEDRPELKDIDTITLYINPGNQEGIYDYLLDLHPRRIIFNPGSENYVLAELAKKRKIEVLEACTLVMLQTGQY